MVRVPRQPSESVCHPKTGMSNDLDVACVSTPNQSASTSFLRMHGPNAIAHSGKQLGWRTHFVSYSNQHLVELEALIGLSHSRELLVKYRRSIAYFQDFLQMQFNRDDVLIGRITKSHIKAYYRFLRINKVNSHNTAIKSMQLCKKVFTMAIEEGIILKHPFRGFSMVYKKKVLVPLSPKKKSP